MGSQRVGHDWLTKHFHLSTAKIHAKRVTHLYREGKRGKGEKGKKIKSQKKKDSNEGNNKTSTWKWMLKIINRLSKTKSKAKDQKENKKHGKVKLSKIKNQIKHTKQK